ncbi:Bor/Iss family lipoprotein [Leptospira gomenensis]|uniref:Bor/Iss family lipoprotein n=1 Tax=Leptospira gomenensis TaxID=2484974 RepID=UPI003CCC844B
MSNDRFFLKIALAAILPFFFGTFAACQHARVRFPQDPPKSCLIAANQKQCKAAMEERERLNAQPSPVHTIPQAFYFWGMSPKNYPVETSSYCANGVREVHQYSTFFDSLYEQLTLGIYSPRTLELVCYN